MTRNFKKSDYTGNEYRIANKDVLGGFEPGSKFEEIKSEFCENAKGSNFICLDVQNVRPPFKYFIFKEDEVELVN